MIEVAIMLLPVAAASGWYFASKHYKTEAVVSNKDHLGYFKGLNHLLNEEPDEAINVFVNLLEVDDETIEIHMALGTLFRQRGEVEKSIRLHQNLIARPQLSRNIYLEVLNELGLDYMRAGLLDRAESIFQELEKEASHKVNAIRQLLAIYQQEKEWLNAIEYALKLECIECKKQPILLSHLYCELAIIKLANKDVNSVEANLTKALKADPLCVRVSVIRSSIYQEKLDYKNALKALLKIQEQSIHFVPVYLSLIMSNFDKLDKPKQKFKFLADLQAINSSTIVLTQFVKVLLEQKGEIHAAAFIRDKLINEPRQGLLKLYADVKVDVVTDQETQFLCDMLKQLDSEKIGYKCEQCGFKAVELHWCCPSCKEWGVAGPVVV